MEKAPSHIPTSLASRLIFRTRLSFRASGPKLGRASQTSGISSYAKLSRGLAVFLLLLQNSACNKTEYCMRYLGSLRCSLSLLPSTISQIALSSSHLFNLLHQLRIFSSSPWASLVLQLLNSGMPAVCPHPHPGTSITHIGSLWLLSVAMLSLFILLSSILHLVLNFRLEACELGLLF